MREFITHESYHNCDCGNEILVLRQYNTYRKPDPQIEIAIFKNSIKTINWKNQLRWIWNIFLGRSLWTDNIILNKNEIERLRDNLNSVLSSISEE